MSETESRVVYPPHIVKTAGVRCGRACIKGSEIAVLDVVRLHKERVPEKEILARFSPGPLTMAQVHQAIGYYYDFTDEIEADLAAEDGREGRG